MDCAVIDIWWGDSARLSPCEFWILRASSRHGCVLREMDAETVAKAIRWAGSLGFGADETRVLRRPT